MAQVELIVGGEPVSDTNPLPTGEASSGLGAVIGAVDDASEPDAAQDATLIAAIKGLNENLTTLLTARGAAGDSAGDNTVIGQLKQIAANTTPS